MLVCLRLLSVLFFFCIDMWIWCSCFPAKYDRKTVLVLMGLYALCRELYGEFLSIEVSPVGGICFEACLLILELILMKILFADSLVENYIVLTCIYMEMAVLNVIYGSLAGSIYRLVSGEDGVLWISTENIRPAGVIALAPYVPLCIFVIALTHLGIRRFVKKRSLRACYVAAGVLFLIEGISNILAYVTIDSADADTFITAYLFIFACMLVAAAAAVFFGVKNFRENRKRQQRMENRMKTQYAAYERITGLQKEMRELRHDLANTLVALGGGGAPYKADILTRCDRIEEKLEEIQ